MAFKSEWEKADQIVKVPDSMIKGIVKQALPNLELKSYKIISGGCVNLNIKLIFANQSPDLVLRIYIRDNSALFKEQALFQKLSSQILHPQIIKLGKFENYNYSIMDFIRGVALSEVLQKNSISEFTQVLENIGLILGKIQKYQFQICGDLDKNLNVIPYPPNQDYISYSYDCLQNAYAKASLDSKTISAISNYLEKNQRYLPDIKNPVLVHGDFDPANIFVIKQNNKWVLSAILDWEFAHSGTFLQDVANMLRYSYQMPRDYEEYFIKGLVTQNIKLPDHWKESVDLLNLTSLLDCLVRDDPRLRPKRLKDIKSLINDILRRYME
jgi:aminoglycoside phosphotransferase (APT) family kinase protein